jgi:hypothetical protein
VSAAGGVEKVATQYFGVAPIKERKMHHLAQEGLGVQYRVHGNDVRTAERGLLERVFYHWETENGVRVMRRPYRPQQHVVNGALGPARNLLLRFTKPVTPMTGDQFLSTLAGSRRARYAEARESVEEVVVTQRDAKLKTFVKAEKINVTAKSDPDPRVIQPRDPRYCYELGLYIKALEPIVYKAIDKLWDSTTVMKGLNADKRGKAIYQKWSSFVNPVAVGLDASRWDQHVSEALLRLEHSVYNSIMHDPRLRVLLEMQIINRGSVYAEDGRIQYTVLGSRMSGDMNTSLGNVLLMSLLVYAYSRTKAFRIELINDGDDCVIIMEKGGENQLGDLGQWFGNLGIVMKVEEPVYVLEHIEFCQSHPIEVTPGVWRMVRDPRTVLDKDLCVVKPVRSEIEHDYYRNAIAQCGLALAGDVPVFWRYYEGLARGTKVSQRLLRKLESRQLETGMDFLARGMSAKLSEPHWVSRVSFAKAFGIWPDEQVALEDHYSKILPTWREPVTVLDVGSIYHG